MTALSPKCPSCVPPILYYDELCPQSRSCLILIKMLDLEVDLQPMNSNKTNISDQADRKVNLVDTLPTLRDDQLSLCDAHTIMIHLCDKGLDDGSQLLYPRDYLPRLNVLNMLFYEGCVLYPCYTQLLAGIISKNFSSSARSHHQANVFDSYNRLDTILKTQLCIVGSTLTIADLSVVTTLSCLDLMVPIMQDQWPNLHRWFENLKKMDCYKYNKEGLQKLFLPLEDKIPIQCGLTSETATMNTEQNAPTDKEDFNETQETVNSESQWHEKISLRQKFFKMFAKDNAHFNLSQILRVSRSPSKGFIATTCDGGETVNETPTCSYSIDSMFPPSEGQIKKKYPACLPSIKIRKDDNVAADNAGQAKKSYPSLLPRVRIFTFGMGSSKVDRDLKSSHADFEMESVTKVENLYVKSTNMDVGKSVTGGSKVCMDCKSGLSILKDPKMAQKCLACVKESSQCAEC